MTDRTYGREKIRGYRQGVKERRGGVRRAAPYSQGWGSLEKYRAWVHGWYVGRYGK